MSWKLSQCFLQGFMDLEATRINSSWLIFKMQWPMSKENLVLRLKVEVDAAGAGELDGQSRICNWLYNHLLERGQQLKQEFISGDSEASKILYTERGLRNQLPKIKEENPFLKVVHSSPLKNTALRLSEAIQVHQKSKKGKRRGKKMGWPKFRSWKRKWFSLFYDEPNKGFKIEGDTLILSLGMGEDRKRRSLTLRLPEAHLLYDPKRTPSSKAHFQNSCFRSKS
jgi:putative transposase